MADLEIDIEDNRPYYAVFVKEIFGWRQYSLDFLDKQFAVNMRNESTSFNPDEVCVMKVTKTFEMMGE